MPNSTKGKEALAIAILKAGRSFQEASNVSTIPLEIVIEVWNKNQSA